MDRIELFKIFCRVVESGSFTRAADTLGMPRSSVSSAIQDLEARVGARLLNRTTRRVGPTQDGLTFYERAMRTVTEVEETEALFRRTSGLPRGRVHANVPGRIGRLVVAPRLPEFMALYPDIVVELGISDRTVDLIEDNIDCVLRVGPLTDSSLIARSIGELQLINVASPAYLAAHGSPSSPADLDAHFAVGYASPTTGRVEDWEWIADGQTHLRPVPSRVLVNSAEGYIACCLAGLGLIQIPAYDVKTHITAGELMEVMPDHRAAPMAMSLLYPHRRQLSRRVHVFVDWLVDVLREDVAA